MELIQPAKRRYNFSDDWVTKITSFDTLDFQELKDKRVALFIQNSVADQKYYSVLTSLSFRTVLFIYFKSLSEKLRA